MNFNKYTQNFPKYFLDVQFSLYRHTKQDFFVFVIHPSLEGRQITLILDIKWVISLIYTERYTIAPYTLYQTVKMNKNQVIKWKCIIYMYLYEVKWTKWKKGLKTLSFICPWHKFKGTQSNSGKHSFTTTIRKTQLATS